VTVIDLENNYYNAKKILNYYCKDVKDNKPEILFWSRNCYYLSTRMYAMVY